MALTDTVTDFISKRNKRERMLLIAAGFAVLFLLLDSVFLRPVLYGLKTLDAEISAKEDLIRRDYRVLSFRDAIMKEVEEYGVYFDSADRTKEEILAGLLRVVENIAVQKSITISSIKPGNLEDKSISQLYTTSLECEGKLRNVLEFMAALEESTYLFRVDSYDLTPKDKTGGLIKCLINISKNIVTTDAEESA